MICRLALLLLLSLCINDARINQQEILSRNLLFGGKKSNWMNWLRSPGVGGNTETLLRPRNSVGGDYQTEDFQSGLDAIRELIADNKGREIRAYGSRYSSNNMPFSDDVSVESWGLNYVRVGIDNTSHLATGYTDKGNLLAFAQSGVMLKHFHQALFKAGLALPTMGATDGQRVVGLAATGSHGSNNVFGAVTNAVKGLHIVTNKETVYIQSASGPTITQAFVDSIGGGRLIEDDDMFSAALIHLGSFGIVHGILMEAEPLYQMELHVRTFPYDDIKDTIFTLNGVEELQFDGIDSMPVHFEVSINPYKKSKDKRSTYVRVLQKLELSPEEIAAIVGRERAPSPGDLALGTLVGGMARVVRASWSLALTSWLKRAIYSFGVGIGLSVFFTRGPQQVAFPFEFFTEKGSDLAFHSQLISSMGTEISVALENLPVFMDTVMSIVHDDPIPCPLSVRYVRSSNQFLSFTRHGTTSATIEFPCPYDNFFIRRVPIVHDKIEQALNARSIPHTWHWGQSLPVNDQWVSKAYGSALQDWKTQRSLLLDAEGSIMFSNDMLRSLGMDD